MRGSERRAGLQQRVLDFRRAGGDQRAVPGMGVGPSFITIANWFPRRERGRVGAFWNISHNVGGGIVAPIVGTAFALLGTEHWQTASYIVPAAVAVLFAVVVLILGKARRAAKGCRRSTKCSWKRKCCSIPAKWKSPGKHERMANLLYLCAEKQERPVRLDGRCVRLHGALRNDQLAAYLSSVGEALSKEEMSVAFLFSNGRPFRRRCWPAGCRISCLKVAACRWR